MKKLLLTIACFALLSACSDAETGSAGNPMNPDDARRESRGKLTGEGGLLSLGKGQDDSGGTIGVNSYLWRATLDTLSFMPLASADPFGGTIITDWFENPDAKGERFKVNAIILDKTLRSDGVRIQVFKQKLVGSTWRDQPTNEKLARDLEDTILTRARELRVAAKK